MLETPLPDGCRLAVVDSGDEPSPSAEPCGDNLCALRVPVDSVKQLAGGRVERLDQAQDDDEPRISIAALGRADFIYGPDVQVVE